MIYLTSTAANEILRLREKRKKPGLMFRLGVQPIGCQGLSYVMEFDEKAQAGDRVFNCDGVQVVIDSESFPYLNGLSLDYSEDLMGGGFRFRNPNVEQSCSCGISFSIAS
jgi:iron-sulfur cluster assembly accessory protein